MTPAVAPLDIASARSAIYGWLAARQVGGRFFVRLEDAEDNPDFTDLFAQALDDLRWLGLDWDAELHHQPAEAYETYYTQLIESGRAYHSFETAEELEQMRRQALAAWRPFRYPRPGSMPDARDVQEARRRGLPVVLRFKMPAGDITVDDQVLGPVTLPAEELDDFVIRDADGRATWLFATVIDDAMMRITHVIRGQEHLPYAHREVSLQEAMGLARPAYAHLPLILGRGGEPLPRSVTVREWRSAGYLPEIVAGFLAQLGWSPPDGAGGSFPEDVLRLFDIRQVSCVSPRFNRQKLLAASAKAMAGAGQERLLTGLRDYLGLSDTPARTADDNALRQLLRLGVDFRTFRELEEKTRFLFVSDEQVVYDERARKKVLGKGSPSGLEILAEAQLGLTGLPDWHAEAIEQWISGLCGRRQLGLPKVILPILVAVSGKAVNLPIVGVLQMLGRQRTLGRIARCLAEGAALR